MDIQLSIMDRYEAARRIKADPAVRLIPINAVTSHAVEDEQKARAAGCDDFVGKSYSSPAATGEDQTIFGLILPLSCGAPSPCNTKR
jgi:CheY-like chemotaxis protein